ncbi:MAG TPA: SulP family inorganic anion transporter [Terriglobia bacterium]|nr:SulP family inorganic anion transporter [Terriglobia bacterium]
MRLSFRGRMSGYNAERFRQDALAGVIVGIVALPLAMAFAIASGVSPDRGLYTAIVAGATISIFGGSRFQIGGPTGAMTPILLVIVVRYGLNNLLLAGLIAGVMLILMGVFRAGAMIRYIPYPVTTGFTSGIAVIIFTGQINNFFGLTGLPAHEQFHLNLLESLRALPHLNVAAVAVALIALAGVLIMPKITSVVPGSLVGMLLATAAVSVAGWPIETIGSRFGGIPRTLPIPRLPAVTFSSVMYVLPPAFTIAILGAIESLLSCVVADSRTGDRHDSNRELVGQGIANCLAPVFGGIAATGAIARTATSIRNGATSPVAGVVHAATLLIIMLLCAPWAGKIPLACMAPVLMVVAYNMSEIHQVRHILKGPRSDIVVLAVTFFLTVFADLTVAVEFGLLAAAVLFIKRMSDTHQIQKVLPDGADPRQKVRAVRAEHEHCPQVTILSVDGALFFGAARKFEQEILEYVPGVRQLILRMGRVPMMDATGEKALRGITESCRKHAVTLRVTGLQPQPTNVVSATGLVEMIGASNMYARTGPAIDAAIAGMDPKICASCGYSAFRECEELKRR